MAKNTPEDKYCGLPESCNTEKNQVDLNLFDNSTISFETKKIIFPNAKQKHWLKKK